MRRRRSELPRGSGLFGDAPPEAPAVAWCRANIDGGSRGNPGPAAYGVVVRDQSGEVVARLKKYIGSSTNNVAEYFGLIAALDYAQAHGFRALRVESDSELMVKQMRGQYKVKSKDLRPLFERAQKMARGLAFFRIEHVYRAHNKEADALVNQALGETSRSRLGHTAAGGKPQAKNADLRIIATYRDGCLVPKTPLPLPDGAEVEILLRLRT